MDILKLFDKLSEDEDLKDIPSDYLFRVVCAVFALIANGKFFYKDDFD